MQAFYHSQFSSENFTVHTVSRLVFQRCDTSSSHLGHGCVCWPGQLCVGALLILCWSLLWPGGWRSAQCCSKFSPGQKTFILNQCRIYFTIQNGFILRGADLWTKTVLSSPHLRWWSFLVQTSMCSTKICWFYCRMMLWRWVQENFSFCLSRLSLQLIQVRSPDSVQSPDSICCSWFRLMSLDCS